MMRWSLFCLALLVLAMGCNTNRPPCTPATCNGCCDEADVCRAGSEVFACGLGGAACVSCMPGTCGGDGRCVFAVTARDAGRTDAAFPVDDPDASVSDAGATDGGSTDAGIVDAGAIDAGVIDAGVIDAGAVDAGERDVTPPTVGLSAFPTSVISPGVTTLTATPMDDVGLLEVEFFEGNTSIGVVSRSPWSKLVSYPSGTAGMRSYRAVARDTSGNTGSSTSLAVSVTAATPSNLYVNPTAGLDTNSGTSAASPFKTLKKAATVAQPGATIFLSAGTYLAADEGSDPSVPLDLPGGITVRGAGATPSTTPGAMRGATSWGNGSTTAFRPLRVRSGAVVIEDVLCHQPHCLVVEGASVLTLRGVGFMPPASSNWPFVLYVTAPAQLGLEPGALPDGDYCLENTATGAVMGAWMESSGSVTMDGGSCLGFGRLNQLPLILQSDGQLTLTNVTLSGSPRTAFFTSAIPWVDLVRGRADLTGCTLEAVRPATGGFLENVQGVRLGIERVLAIAPRLSLVDTVLRGFGGGTSPDDASAAIVVDRAGQTDTGDAFVTIRRGSVSTSRWGIRLRSGAGGTAHVDLADTTLDGHAQGGLAISNFDGSRVTLRNVAVSGNGGSGVTLSGAGAAHWLELRRSTFRQNAALDVSLEGGLEARFDLGTTADAGGNVFLGTPSVSHLGANLAPDAGVAAVGNTWTGSAQQADVNGRYDALAPADGGAFVLLGPIPLGANVTLSSPSSVRLSGGP